MKSQRFSGKPKKRKPIILRRVIGQSMAPTLREGSIIAARTVFKHVHPQDIVVVDHDGIEKIKRIEKISGNKIFIVGDNESRSTDSRDFGWISRDAVVAKLILSK